MREQRMSERVDHYPLTGKEPGRLSRHAVGTLPEKSLMCTSASMGQDVRPCRGTEDHRVRGKTFSKRTDQGGLNHLTLGITDRKTNVSCNWTKGLTSWRYYRTETENPCHS